MQKKDERLSEVLTTVYLEDEYKGPVKTMEIAWYGKEKTLSFKKD